MSTPEAVSPQVVLGPVDPQFTADFRAAADFAVEMQFLAWQSLQRRFGADATALAPLLLPPLIETARDEATLLAMQRQQRDAMERQQRQLQQMALQRVESPW